VSEQTCVCCDQCHRTERARIVSGLESITRLVLKDSTYRDGYYRATLDVVEDDFPMDDLFYERENWADYLDRDAWGNPRKQTAKPFFARIIALIKGENE